MKTLLLGLALALAAGGAAGCGKDSCEKLAKEICDGKGDEACTQAQTWLDGEMVDLDGTKLSKDQADAACEMILDDQRALSAYKIQFERRLSSN
jgi:hypothetical protein